MNYILLVIGGEEYRLRLTTRACIDLEKKLGKNPLQMFMEIDGGTLPKVGDIIIMLHTMLQTLQHGISLDRTYDLFDEYLLEGHNMFDIIPVFMDVFMSAGFINDTKTETKNQ